jgi:fibronectin-binding autotransporter adhesin
MPSVLADSNAPAQRPTFGKRRADRTYSSPTNVTSGTLLANNTSGSATGTSVVTVSGTGIFGGSGIVTSNATINSGGTLAPGNEAVGVLGTGNLTFNSGSHLGLELLGTTPATGYDQVNVTGTVALNGSDLQLSLGAFTPAPGDLFYLILNDGPEAITGSFAGFSEGSFFSAGGQDFQITYLANWTGSQATSTFTGGNDVALQAVPEPAVSVALLTGFGLLLRRRRRA